ncbi:MAG TPA: c-type cytochrome [Gemmatimonadaceae bacterium]|nr:c-type cytochrome [Gemmatimonadaceae bacterium]
MRTAIAVLLLALVAGACDRGAGDAGAPRAAGDSGATASSGASASGARAVLAVARVPFRVPADSEIPDGPVGAAIRRGRAILRDTRDSLPQNVGNALRCVSCHLQDGTRKDGMPWVGVVARFPQYRSRNGRVITIEDRVNGCFQRSMNGHVLDVGSDAMRDIVAYLTFLSRGVPIGAEVEGQGVPRVDPLPGDTAQGARLFAANCARCHGADGQGTVVAPPLWGPRSFNIGAGMARIRTAAAFIKHEMPFDRPGTLTDQQAYDIAAYVTSRPRPDYPPKIHDWPNGDAPPDAAYETEAGRKRTGS